MKLFYDCKNEEEKQKLRDDMLEHIYYQVIMIRNDVDEIKKQISEVSDNGEA